MDIELISAKTMCDQMHIDMETFRKTWKRWKHERVDNGHTLKSMRFYWSKGPVPEEADNGNHKISDEKGARWWTFMDSRHAEKRYYGKKNSGN